MNLIVSNDTNKKYPVEGRVLSIDDFMKEATSDEGLELDGKLYFNVNLLDEDLYNQIKESFPDYGFFKTEDITKPFITETIEDFQEKQAPAPQTAPQQNYNAPANNNASNTYHNVGEKSFDPNDIPDTLGEEEKMNMESLLRTTTEAENLPAQNTEEGEGNPGRVILFGSSKGGTGKTFTCLISAYRYSKTHPNERIALADFDIIDGQVGISIHKVTPTVFNYYKQWKMGQRDFSTMSASRCQSERFPSNIDFYLAPKDNLINNDEFWSNVFLNLIDNYDVIFFDSGIDYLNYTPISTLYKIADKIVLISTTSIKSVSSVIKQIGKLKGEIPNKVFSAEDEIGPRLNLVLTQVGKNDEMNATIMKTFQEKVPIIAVFGQISSDVQRAEFFGEWNIFDKNTRFNEALDKICQ